MAERAERKIKTALKYRWVNNGFFVGSGSNTAYYDRGYEPIFESHFDNKSVRQQLLERLPIIVDSKTKEFIPEFTKVFSPSTINSDHCLYFGADRTIVNNTYAPLTVIANVIRDYYSEFKSVVNGVIVDSEKTYEDIKERFNNLYIKLVSFKFTAAFILGSCTIDDFVLLGGLFYILQMTCNNRNGLTFDDGLFDNEWSGIYSIITVNDRTFKCYSEKLKRVNFCSITKEAFVNRFVEVSDEFSLWYYEYFTDSFNDTVTAKSDSSSPESILNDLRECCIKLGNTRSKIICLMYSDSMFNEDLIEQIKGIKLAENLYKSFSEGLYLETDVMSANKGEIKKYTIITNYDTRDMKGKDNAYSTATAYSKA